MAELLFYPILVILLILQTVIIRHLPLLGGTADLLLLWLVAWGLQNRGKHVWYGALFAGILMGFVSAVPWYASFISYLVIAGLSRFLNKRFWQSPLIALFIVTFICSLSQNLIVFTALKISGAAINWDVALRQITVPSVFLNLLLALPVYAIVNDMAQWIYPPEANA